MLIVSVGEMCTEERQSQIPPGDQWLVPPTQVKFIDVNHPLVLQLGTELEAWGKLARIP